MTTFAVQHVHKWRSFISTFQVRNSNCYIDKVSNPIFHFDYQHSKIGHQLLTANINYTQISKTPTGPSNGNGPVNAHLISGHSIGTKDIKDTKLVENG